MNDERGSGLFWGIIPAFGSKSWGKPWERRVTTAGDLPKIRRRHGSETRSTDTLHWVCLSCASHLLSVLQRSSKLFNKSLLIFHTAVGQPHAAVEQHCKNLDWWTRKLGSAPGNGSMFWWDPNPELRRDKMKLHLCNSESACPSPFLNRLSLGARMNLVTWRQPIQKHFYVATYHSLSLIRHFHSTLPRKACGMLPTHMCPADNF